MKIKRKMSFLLGMIILGQSMALQAMNMGARQPDSLESQAARKYAQGIVAFAVQMMAEGNKSFQKALNEAFADLYKKKVASVESIQLIRNEIPGAILSKQSSLPPALQLIYAYDWLSKEYPGETVANASRLASLLGNDSYWGEHYTEILFAMIGLPNKYVSLQEVMLRLVLTPNAWDSWQKNNLIDKFESLYPSSALSSNIAKALLRALKPGAESGIDASILGTVTTSHRDEASNSVMVVENPAINMLLAALTDGPWAERALSIAVELGVDPNALFDPESKSTLLTGAIYLHEVYDSENLGIMQALLKMGATIDTGNISSNVLINAVNMSSIDAVRLLLEHASEQITKDMILAALGASQRVAANNAGNTDIAEKQRLIQGLLNASLQKAKK